MAKKSKSYRFVKFAPQVFRNAYRVFRDNLSISKKKAQLTKWVVEYDDTEWEFNAEDEFFSEYRKDISFAYVWYSHSSSGELEVFYWKTETQISVTLPSRTKIEEVFEVFEDNYDKYKIGEESTKETIRQHVKVFIGHGRSDQWRDLKDHLQDRQGFKVIAYETGARAGRAIPNILEEMSKEASIAFLVYTGEDMDKDGMLHARENVIHETGLFQGKLGWKRSIVLLEEGCNEFSNIVGVEQLRFSKGNIRETFGDVVAIIFREFEGRE